MIPSKNIVSVDLDNSNKLIYHRWFGNPMIVDNNTYENLLAGDNSVQQNEELLNGFASSGFLFKSEEHEIETFRNAVNANTKPILNGENICSLDLIVSQRCNFGCSHCIYFAGNERSNHPDTLMVFDIAQKAWSEYLSLMRKNDKKDLVVHFGGAEPLTNWSLIKQILNSFPSDLQEDEKILWSINTNLSLVNNETITYLKKFEIEIHTSLDGNEFANDLIRTDIAGGGTYKKICDKIDLLYSNGLCISNLAVTLTEKNFEYFDNAFVEWVSEKGITQMGLDIDLVGSPNVNPIQAADKLVSIYWACRNIGLDCAGTWLNPFLNIVNKDVRNEVVAFCGAIRGVNMTITPKGAITLCSFMSTHIGNVNNVENIFQHSSNYQKLVNERQPGRDSHCFGCIIEGHCGGQCHITREVASKHKNYANIEKMCDFYRYATTKMLEIYASQS